MILDGRILLVGNSNNGGQTFDYWFSSGEAIQVTPTWAQNNDKMYGHGMTEKDGLLLCGGLNSGTCNKLKFGTNSWNDVSKNMIQTRGQDSSSIIMGGIFVNGGWHGSSGVN